MDFFVLVVLILVVLGVVVLVVLSFVVLSLVVLGVVVLVVLIFVVFLVALLFIEGMFVIIVGLEELNIAEPLWSNINAGRAISILCAAVSFLNPTGLIHSQFTLLKQISRKKSFSAIILTESIETIEKTEL